jgi:hypothetical protein
MEIRINRLEDENRVLKEENRVLKEENRVLKEENRVLKEEINSLKDEISMLKAKVDEWSQADMIMSYFKFISSIMNIKIGFSLKQFISKIKFSPLEKLINLKLGGGNPLLSEELEKLCDLYYNVKFKNVLKTNFSNKFQPFLLEALGYSPTNSLLNSSSIQMIQKQLLNSNK